MIAWLQAKAAKWIALAGVVLAAVTTALAYAFHRGAQAEATANTAQRATERATAAETARDTVTDAAAAATAVQQAAQAAPPPNTVTRDDFDNHF